MESTQEVFMVERQVVVMMSTERTGLEQPCPAIQPASPAPRVVTVDNDDSSDR